MKPSCLSTVTSALWLGTLLSASGAVTGQWDFNSGNLAATVGSDLAYYGGIESATTFSNATIGGANAGVMNFPAAAEGQGYQIIHGIAPNGEGFYANQYTLIMDIMFPAASSDTWRALFQTSPEDGNDGDLFVNTANGIGISGTYTGAILPDTWHRVAFVLDLTLPENQLRKFIDGTLVGTQSGGEFGLDGRFALDTTALLFADDNGETAAGSVNSIQIHDVPLSDADIFALGKATAAGIPAQIPVFTNLTVAVTPTNATRIAGMNSTCFEAVAVGSGTLTYQWYHGGVAVPGQMGPKLRLTPVTRADAGEYVVVVKNGLQTVTNTPPVVLAVQSSPATVVTGQWDFQQGNLNASLGQPLQYFDSQVEADTAFGTTTDFGITDLDGQPVKVLAANPSSGGAWGGYVVSHGIAPSNGGAKVNQYTVILDLLYTSSVGGYRGLWQTDPSNTTDSDVFVNGDNGLGISQRYDGLLAPDTWHRVVLAFDLSQRELGKYIDGTNVVTTAVGATPFGVNDAHYLADGTDPLEGGGIDMRWSLEPTALLFADEDGEVQPVFVSSIQVRSGRMTDAEVAALGGPTASKIPAPVSTSIQAKLAGKSVVIDWTGATLESATTPLGPWTTVTGAQHPHNISSPAGNQFFRVPR